MSRFHLLTVCFAVSTMVGCGTQTPSEQAANDQDVENIAAAEAGHTEVSADVFHAKVEGEPLVLAKFGAPWCGPCVQVDKELDKLEADNGQQLTVVRINVDDEPELAEELEISAIPVTMLFKNGEEVEQWLGYKEANVFQAKIDEVK